MIRIANPTLRSVEDQYFHVIIFRHDDEDIVHLELECLEGDILSLDLWVQAHLYNEEYNPNKTTFRIFGPTGVELK